MLAHFASDLHGQVERYQKLFAAIRAERPAAVFLGGDLLPSGFGIAVQDAAHPDFISNVLRAGFADLKRDLLDAYPRVFLILGNDDPRVEEAALLEGAEAKLWEYIHERCAPWGARRVYGYACVPPTPYLLKDWERYDVSRFVDPGCLSPEEGFRSVPVLPNVVRHGTIQEDLERLAGDDDVSNAIFLFHSPPYRTKLDRAALDGMAVDFAPLDVHVGSIAIRRFIEVRQPLATLHGHIHESARLTASWRDQIGGTHLFGAAHDGPELALVRFDLDHLDAATRTLL